MEHLVQMLRRGEVAQADPPEVEQGEVARQAISHEIDRRLRQQNLPAVRRIHDAGCTVDGAAVKVLLRLLHHAHVDAAARTQRDTGGVDGIRQRQLQLDRRTQRRERIWKCRVDPVARHLDDAPAVLRHRRVCERIVPRERRTHPLGVLLPQAAAAFDVGEEQGGDRSGRALRPRGTILAFALGHVVPGLL